MSVDPEWLSDPEKLRQLRTFVAYFARAYPDKNAAMREFLRTNLSWVDPQHISLCRLSEVFFFDSESNKANVMFERGDQYLKSVTAKELRSIYRAALTVNRAIADKVESILTTFISINLHKPLDDHDFETKFSLLILLEVVAELNPEKAQTLLLMTGEHGLTFGHLIMISLRDTNTENHYLVNYFFILLELLGEKKPQSILAHLQQTSVEGGWTIAHILLYLTKPTNVDILENYLSLLNRFAQKKPVEVFRHLNQLFDPRVFEPIRLIDVLRDLHAEYPLSSLAQLRQTLRHHRLRIDLLSPAHAIVTVPKRACSYHRSRNQTFWLNQKQSATQDVGSVQSNRKFVLG